MNHIVIVGGGFAGLNCARKLSAHPDVRITLIDKNNYQQFQPLLYQVATAILTPGNALGGFANISGVDGKPLPQLASVAQQAGRYCADAIAASIAGDPVKPFRYFDMGIMAMIGRNAAVT